VQSLGVGESGQRASSFDFKVLRLPQSGRAPFYAYFRPSAANFAARCNTCWVGRMRGRTGHVARHPKPSLYGDRSMNAFRTTRLFALAACMAVATLSFSTAAHAKNGGGGSSCHSSSGSCHSSCHSGSYCSSYCPSYCSSYCPSYCPSYSSYCPSYCSYPVSYCEPTTYCAPQTYCAPVTCSYTPVTEYVPVTNYVPTTTCSYSCAPTCSYPTYSTSCYQPTCSYSSCSYPTCSYPSCNYSSCFSPSYNSSCHTSGNFKFKK
jgi:hypothetical protein